MISDKYMRKFPNISLTNEQKKSAPYRTNESRNTLKVSRTSISVRFCRTIVQLTVSDRVSGLYRKIVIVKRKSKNWIPQKLSLYYQPFSYPPMKRILLGIILIGSIFLCYQGILIYSGFSNDTDRPGNITILDRKNEVLAKLALPGGYAEAYTG